MFKTLRLAAPILATLVLSASAFAQDTSLDGLWFKLRISGHGYAARDDGSAPRKLSGTQTAYLHLTVSTGAVVADGLSLPSQNYHFDLWTQTGQNSWDLTYSDTESIESTNGKMFFISDMNITVVAENGISIDAYLTAMLRVNRDKNGIVTSASFTTLGAEIDDGSTPQGEVVRGGLAASGKTVWLSSLPFLP
jgi:hypothetical protein